MTEKHVHSAFCSEALFAKSQLYISRGHKAFQAKELEEYQLWAALALELLGKSTLAWFSPTLVADPQCVDSLFAACGVSKEVDVKSITASTLLKRLGKLSKRFDHRVKQFCTSLTLRRNAEIHSGESPFLAMELKAWENAFWHTADVLLGMQKKSLDDWLIQQVANEKKRLLHDVCDARQKSITERIRIHRQGFIDQFKNQEADRKNAIERSRSQCADAFSSRFSNSDSVSNEECPACDCFAVVGGVKWIEEVVETEYDPDSAWSPIEVIETGFVIEELWCPHCSLQLDGVDEILASGVSSEFLERSEREMEFEPDYGND